MWSSQFGSSQFHDANLECSLNCIQHYILGQPYTFQFAFPRLTIISGALRDVCQQSVYSFSSSRTSEAIVTRFAWCNVHCTLAFHTRVFTRLLDFRTSCAYLNLRANIFINFPIGNVGHLICQQANKWKNAFLRSLIITPPTN